MTKDQIVDIINEYRQKFNPQADHKKGMRFFDDDRVIRRLRMDFFHEENLSRLPTMEQFIERANLDFVRKNVMNALMEQAAIDYHYYIEKDWV